jgi:hypothetical protein
MKKERHEMRTERQMLLDFLYNENTLARVKEEIMSAFPDCMYDKGTFFIAVDDVEKTESLLKEHMEENYRSLDYYKELGVPLFFENSGHPVDNWKFTIPKVDVFMRKLVSNGVRIYDYECEMPKYGCCC